MTYTAFVFYIILSYALGSLVTFLCVYPPRRSHALPVYRTSRPMRNSELAQVHGENVAKSKPDFQRGFAAFGSQNRK